MVVIVLRFALVDLVVVDVGSLRFASVYCWLLAGCGLLMIGRLAVPLRITWVLSWCLLALFSLVGVAGRVVCCLL